MLIDRVIVGSMFTNSYIVSVGRKECIIIDPGDESETLVKRLEAMNLLPLAIIFTHGHVDHTAGAAGIISYYEGRNYHISVGIHREDAQFLGVTSQKSNREIFSTFGKPGMEALNSYASEIPKPEFLFHEGDTILDSDIVVIHTPGHSPGSSCFYSEPREAVFTGDTLFFNTIGRSNFPTGEPELVERAVTDRLFTLPPSTRVLPGHGPVSSIEREIKNNSMVSEGATI